jgi:hypothetical protein
MQDVGYGLRRIPLPRTSVNKGNKKGRGYSLFYLLGMRVRDDVAGTLYHVTETGSHTESARPPPSYASSA